MTTSYLDKQTYFFCGVGGSGMSALAKILLSRGKTVIGSDRNYDAGRFTDLYDGLKQAGVKMVAQDGNAMSDVIDYCVVSSAIEPSIPDIGAAQSLDIPIIKRAELLADICNNTNQSITVGGTNGKSTTTAMIGHILHKAGLGPDIINGAGMLNFNRDNAVIGNGKTVIAESDESDGSITLYHPSIAVLTNIAEDHKSMDELMDIFDAYLSQSIHQVLNIDCPNVSKLAEKFPQAMIYSMNDVPTDLKLLVPGGHNKSNAMAAIKVAELCGVSQQDAIKYLSDFKGVVSRLEVIGEKNNILVIDDFGHNPDKIEAGLKTLKSMERRLILMYQPHGFAPTRQHKDQLIEIFLRYLAPEDRFYMPDILYFGGTVTKDISSVDIINPLKDNGLNACYIADKGDITDDILNHVQSGDIVCIMGARDDSLREMAKEIYQKL